MTFEWTPERTAALMTLWNQGIAASEIGRRLGVSKNAVIGKAFRLQLPKRRPTAAEAPEEGRVIRLEQLGAHMCSWPLASADADGYRFCGERSVAGKPYCETHCRAAYVSMPKNRKKAAVA